MGSSHFQVDPSAKRQKQCKLGNIPNSAAGNSSVSSSFKLSVYVPEKSKGLVLLEALRYPISSDFTAVLGKASAMYFWVSPSITRNTIQLLVLPIACRAPA